MRALRVCLMVGVAVALLPLAPAFAEWSRQQRVTFRDGCVSACQKGDVTKGVWCQTMCACRTSELEKAYPDPRQFERLVETPDAAFAQRSRAIEQTCRNRY